MKIKAGIPVEKIAVVGGITYRHEVREVEVIKVMRHPVSLYHNLNRWHYQAQVKFHEDLHDDMKHLYRNDGFFTVNIVRRGLNNSWKPPVFRDGKNSVSV
jgi:hypothetical protein